MWTVLKAVALRFAIGRTLGGMLATLFLLLVPIAGVLKVVGLPILIVLGVVGAPLFLLLAAIGLPVLARRRLRRRAAPLRRDAAHPRPDRAQDRAADHPDRVAGEVVFGASKGPSAPPADLPPDAGEAGTALKPVATVVSG